MLYSDGITDHMNPGGIEYGRSRLASLIRAQCAQPPAEIITAIFRDLDDFNTHAFDDQTLFVLKVV